MEIIRCSNEATLPTPAAWPSTFLRLHSMQSGFEQTYLKVDRKIGGAFEEMNHHLEWNDIWPHQGSTNARILEPFAWQLLSKLRQLATGRWSHDQSICQDILMFSTTLHMIIDAQGCVPRDLDLKWGCRSGQCTNKPRPRLRNETLDKVIGPFHCDAIDAYRMRIDRRGVVHISIETDTDTSDSSHGE